MATSNEDSDSFISFSFLKNGERALIDVSYFKWMKKNTIQLLTHIKSETPISTVIFNILTFWRVLQFFLPSVCAQITTFWGNDKDTERFLVIVRFFISYLSIGNIDEWGNLLFFVFLVSFLAIFGILYYSILHFRKHASLPSALSKCLAYSLSVFFILYIPPLLMIIGYSISKMIFVTKIYPILTLVLILLTLALSSIFSYIIILTESNHLTFYPSSLMSVTPYPPNIFFVLSLIGSFFYGLSYNSPKNLQYGLCAFVILIIIFGGMSTKYYGGFISSSLSSLLISFSISGTLMALSVLFMDMSGMKGSLTHFFLFFLLFVILLFVTPTFLRSKQSRNLDILDSILENNDSFETITSPNEFVNICMVGYSYVHPLAIDWSLVRLGINKWPDNEVVLFFLAKFLAIYSSEKTTLSWILQNVRKNKIKGFLAKCIKNEALMIMHLRETSLNSALKSRMNEISKKVQTSKDKLRRVWDMIIQGNINEIETNSKRAFESIDNLDAEFKHIISQYPNNRYVTRNYTRFLGELKADYAGKEKYYEITRMLQKGYIANKDNTYSFGLFFFPNLPSNIITQQSNNLSQFNVVEGTIAASTDMDFEDDHDIPQQESMSLASTIESITIPSIRSTSVIRLIIGILSILIIPLALVFYSLMYVDELLAPISFMYDLCHLRTLVYQMSAFSVRFYFESVNTIPKAVPLSFQKPPVSLGGTWDIQKQLATIVESASTVIQKLENLRTFQSDSVNIKTTKYYLFEPSYEYMFFDVTTYKYSFVNLTLQGSIMDYVVNLIPFLSPNVSLTLTDFYTPVIINIMNNCNPLAELISSVLGNLLDFLTEIRTKNITTSYNYAMILIIAIMIISIISVFIQINSIKNNKVRLFSAIITLPKNVISQLSDGLKHLKAKNEESGTTSTTNSDMNKQEESIMKLFNVGIASNYGISDFFFIILGTILTSVLIDYCIFSIYQLIEIQSQQQVLAAPHLNNIMGSYAYKIGALYSASIYASSFAIPHMLSFYRKSLITNYQIRSARADGFFELARFGNSVNNSLPFEGFNDGIRAVEQTQNCPKNHTIDRIEDIISCYSVDYLYRLIDPLFHSKTIDYQDYGIPLTMSDTVFSTIWLMMIDPVLEGFFGKMFEEIIPTIQKALTKEMNRVFIILFVLVLTCILIEGIIISKIYQINHFMKSVLGLFSHFKPSVLLMNSHIVRVLSGDFSEESHSYAVRDNEFYEKLLNEYPDGYIYSSSNGIIEGVNMEFMKLFGIESQTMVGQNIKDFMNSLHIDTTKKTPFVVEIESKKFLKIDSLSFNKLQIISIRDVTDLSRYQSLIENERALCDRLLESILPSQLVTRVQNGESEISFLIQSASVVFIDIVEFTPWCSSRPASTVMNTLCQLFKRFDNVIKKYTTMTKVKCIGDCYVAAGGVFSEVNQPSEHAKQALYFGLDTIQQVEELNQEINEKIQIRVGINTGGPIVGGVMGTKKPSFEILGPSINIAQQMEHNGIPMRVHISRDVYELIYGDNSLEIKEKGSLEIKQGTFITYLVQKRK